MAVAAAVDPAGDRAVSRAVDRVATRAASQAVNQVTDPIVVLVNETSVVRRNVRPVVGPVASRAVSQVDSEPISRAAKVAPLALADQVRDAPPMIVRNARPVRWARLSRKKSTSPTSTQLF